MIGDCAEPALQREQQASVTGKTANWIALRVLAAVAGIFIRMTSAPSFPLEEV